MGAPLREPRVVKSPLGGNQTSYSLSDIGELVPSSRHGKSQADSIPNYAPIPNADQDEVREEKEDESLVHTSPPVSEFGGDEKQDVSQIPLPLLPRPPELEKSKDCVSSKAGSSPPDSSPSPSPHYQAKLSAEQLPPYGSSGSSGGKKKGGSGSFRTLHASAKGLLRTHPIASENNLYEAFCGRKISDLRRASRMSKFCQTPVVNNQADEPLDWVIAIAVPAPGVHRSQMNITEAHAEAIYQTCFKGEEYEQTSTAFSMQSDAAATELRSFMKAFQELPDTDGSRPAKAQNVGRRMSRDCTNTPISDSGEEKRVPRSFTCLVRNAIVTKLVLHCGLRVKCIPSEDHQQVVLLVSCSHYELLREADRQSLPTEMDVHAADPESLEPCTETMIPLLYWFHSSNDAEKADSELREALETLVARRQEALDGLPQKAQGFHQNSTEFWETLRGFSEIDANLGTIKKMFKSSHESSWTQSFNRYGSWKKDDVDPTAHFGSKDKAAQAKQAFLQYMKAKIADPLSTATKMKMEVNRVQKQKGHYQLRNYYEQLGVQEISAHAGFEVGTYFGSGQSTQCLWRHFSVRTLPPQPLRKFSEESSKRVYEKHIATPFRNHQIIKLIVDIISRQMDIGRLIDLGFVNSMFPLDSRDKVEEPENWVVESEESGQEYWFNVETKQVTFEMPPELEDGSHHRPASSLIKAWGYPPKELPALRRASVFLYSFLVWPSLQKVRDYYGEEIALYFALTQHLTYWCIVPAALGIVTGIMEALIVGYKALAYIHIAYGILISCWGSLWLESWKRTEAQLAATWGLLGISEQEVLRPAFEGVSRRSPIDFDNDMDRVEAFCCRYGRVGRFPRQIASAACLFFMALVHNVLMVLLLTLRGTWVERGWAFVQYSNLVVATGFALQMTLFSFIIYRSCVILNRWENYRTHADYTKAFIIKQCALEFVNQFAIFFYIGLMKGAVDGCIVVDSVTDELVRTPSIDISKLDNIEKAMCSQELRDAVKNVLLAFACMNVVEITLPAFILPKLRSLAKDFFKAEADPELRRRGTAEEARFIGWTMSRIVQAMLNKEVYSTVEASGTYDDYIEVMVFFGHVSMFSMVFPFCPLIVLVLLVIEIRVDGHKLFHTLRRPLPKNAGSIGAWHYIFQFITWVSVITNALILSWGMEEDELHWLKTSSTATKWLFTVCLILGLVIFKAVIIVGVPDIPGPLTTLLLHHEWVCQQLSSNNVAIGPRHFELQNLDTRIHSAFSEQRTFSVDFAVNASDLSTSPRGGDTPTFFGKSQ